MKRKLVGKIFAILFALFTCAFMFMPQIQYKLRLEAPGVRAEEALMASNVAPIDYIKALFADKEDLEKAKEDYEAAKKAIKEEREEAGLDNDVEIDLSNTKEATRYVVLLLALEENPLGDPLDLEEAEAVNAISEMKTYAYISIAMLIVTLVMIAVLILRCFFPKNKFLNIFGNLWSILLFVGSIGLFFASMIPSVVYTLSGPISFSIALAAEPIFVMSIAFALVSLVTMILALSTKGVKKVKQQG